MKGHYRQVRKKRKAKRTSRAGALPYVVRDERNGRVVSRHRTYTAAIKARARYDRASYRRGQGRPYSAERA